MVARYYSRYLTIVHIIVRERSATLARGSNEPSLFVCTFLNIYVKGDFLFSTRYPALFYNLHSLIAPIFLPTPSIPSLYPPTLAPEAYS